MPSDRDERWDDDRLEREEGVLVHAGGGSQEGCDEEVEACAPDEIVEDPVDDRHVPGTPDDLPYDYGVEVPPPADQQLHSVISEGSRPPVGAGRTGAPSGREEPELGRAEERELWSKQEPLIEESEAEERHYRGLEGEQEVPEVHEAMAEDSAEPFPEAPGGTSATGAAD